MCIKIRKCTHKDVPLLQEIGYETFKESFQHLNTPENMEAYLEKAFHSDQLAEELSNASSSFYFLYVNEKLAGYLKVNVGDAQTDEVGDEALEIERIYIRSEFQGQGLGRDLINKGIELAKALNKTQVWLGVWEKNAGAIRFYKKMGFVETGTHSFYMGDEEQTDYLMVKTLI